jgi:type IV pilus assembly protein PilO
MEFEELFFKVSNLQRILILAAVFLVILALFYLLVISDLISPSMEAEIANLQREIVQQEVRLKREPVVKERLSKSEAEFEALVQSLPEKQDFESLSKQIVQLLSEIGTEPLSLERKEKETVNEDLQLAAIPFDLNIKGDYLRIGTFMNRLKDLPRVIDFPLITLRPKQKEPSKASHVTSLEAQMKARTFRRLSDEEIKNIAKSKKPAPAGEKR